MKTSSKINSNMRLHHTVSKMDSEDFNIMFFIGHDFLYNQGIHSNITCPQQVLPVVPASHAGIRQSCGFSKVPMRHTMVGAHSLGQLLSGVARFGPGVSH